MLYLLLNKLDIELFSIYQTSITDHNLILPLTINTQKIKTHFNSTKMLLYIA